MEEIIIDTIEWQAPEYTHKKRSVDFLWTIGLIALLASGVAFWFTSYIFAIFILISGACLIMFTIREPEEINFSIKTEGLMVGKDKHEWKSIKGFNIKSGEPYGKLLIETSRYFLPVYTIPIPSSLIKRAKESLQKVIPNIEIMESGSMAFAEKIGF